MEDFPPNSHKSRAAQAPKKPRVEAVVEAGSAKRKRPPLGKRFKETFFSGDARTARDYVILYVIVPTIKDLVTETSQTIIERMVHGDTRPRRRPGLGGPPSGPGGVVDYRGKSLGPAAGSGPKTVSRPARARHDFDEIVLSSRRDAEEVIERLFDLVSQFEVATVADLYELVNMRAEHTDEKWGWTDMTGARVDRLRTGDFLIDLPKPEAL